MQVVDDDIVSSDDAIKELANAVIIQACRDYLDNRTLISRQSIEDFFCSAWFESLSRGALDSQAIIEYLKRTAAKNERGGKFYYRPKGKAPNGTRTQELGWYLSKSGKKR